MTTNKTVNTILQLLLLGTIGFLLLLLCNTVQHTPSPAPGEYHYSNLLRNNFKLLAIILFTATGLATGYFFRLNAWLTGFGLILIFPLTAIIEGTVYKGSHNLIPFEMVIFAVYALPAIAAAFAGKLLAQKINKTNSR